MNNNIVRYQRSLSRKLPCTGVYKERLLDKFRASLSSFMEENPSPTAQELHTAFGPPEEMANLLAEKITDAEKTQYRHSKLVRSAAIGVALALVLSFTGYIYFVKDIGVTVKETTVIDNCVPSPTDSELPG